MKKSIIASISLTLIASCANNSVPTYEDVPVAVEQPTEPMKGVKNLWPKEEYELNAREMIRLHGRALTSSVPSDINMYCPIYGSFNSEQREDFWVMVFSVMAKYESNFRPLLQYKESFKDSQGQWIISRGLLQLSIESSRGYHCILANADQLHDPRKNLECGVRILSRWVEKDGVLAMGSGSSSRGGARYWSVLRTSSNVNAKLKADMRKLCFLQ